MIIFITGMAHGTDHSEINKTEGYEVIYFLNHIGKKNWHLGPDTLTYRKMESILRNHVPARTTHRRLRVRIKVGKGLAATGLSLEWWGRGGMRGGRDKEM